MIPLRKVCAGVYKIFLELVPLHLSFDVLSPFYSALWQFQRACGIWLSFCKTDEHVFDVVQGAGLSRLELRTADRWHAP